MMKMEKAQKIAKYSSLGVLAVVVLATVPHWQEIYDYVAPVYYKNCKTATIKHGTVEKGFKGISSPIIEKITVQEGRDGEEEVCDASKLGYEQKRTVKREPTTEIVSYRIRSSAYESQDSTEDEDDEETGGAICRDGTRSYSVGRGTCSHHGGVRQWL